MEDYRYKGMTAEEWENLANPAPATDEQLKDLGFLEQEQTNQSSNKLYETADKLGIEHPDEQKQYEQLSVGESIKDGLVSLGVEASHIFAPKSKEILLNVKHLKKLYNYPKFNDNALWNRME